MLLKWSDPRNEAYIHFIFNVMKTYLISCWEVIHNQNPVFIPSLNFGEQFAGLKPFVEKGLYRSAYRPSNNGHNYTNYMVLKNWCMLGKVENKLQGGWVGLV